MMEKKIAERSFFVNAAYLHVVAASGSNTLLGSVAFVVAARGNAVAQSNSGFLEVLLAVAVDIG